MQGAIATTMTQPLDVLKTRAMNAKPGEFKGAMDLIRYTGRTGPMAFYKVRKLNQFTIINDIFIKFLFLGIHSCICQTWSTNNLDFCIFRAAQNELWNNCKVTTAFNI